MRTTSKLLPAHLAAAVVLGGLTNLVLAYAGAALSRERVEREIESLVRESMCFPAPPAPTPAASGTTLFTVRVGPGGITVDLGFPRRTLTTSEFGAAGPASFLPPPPGLPATFDATHLTWPGLFTNSLFYAVALWLLIRVPLALGRHIRRRRGLCAACGYRVVVGDVCSECGAIVTERARVSRDARSTLRYVQERWPSG